MLNLNGPIWKFALDFYGRPGIAPACLCLQDQVGLDVVHLILVLYMYTELHQSTSLEDIQTARVAMASWRGATVLPLREIRKALKVLATAFPNEQEAVRSRIKEVELLAEQVQLAEAARWLNTKTNSTGLRMEEALQALVIAYDEHRQRHRGPIDAALCLIADTAKGLRN